MKLTKFEHQRKNFPLPVNVISITAARNAFSSNMKPIYISMSVHVCTAASDWSMYYLSSTLLPVEVFSGAVSS